jgi:hypothetical protein
MTINNPSAGSEYSFKKFMFDNQSNRIILWMVAVATIIQFGIFKYLYPYASFIHGDSFAYINTANKNPDISTYMVGYARFLRFFSVFSNSDFALTAFQYLLIQSSAMFLLFTIFYFYKPAKTTQFILIIFMLFNPLFLYLSNLVSSDCFFAALSLAWFSLLLWILHRPTVQIIIWHTLLLFIAFTVRYNALIYPVIAAVAIGLSPMSLRRKLLSIAMGVLACGLFIIYTGNKYKALTGSWQYSPFSGWQIANNGMYAYRYVDSRERKPVPQQFEALDNMIRAYFDSTRDTKKHWIEETDASTFYMWDSRLPLMQYKDHRFEKDSTATRFKKWASMGPLYTKYGVFIIKQYPFQYIGHFLWPNSKKYFAPPVEFLESYNSGKDSVYDVAKNWFGYKTRHLYTRTGTLNIRILNFYPTLTGTMNVVLAACLVCFLLLHGLKKKTPFRQCIVLVSVTWLTNAGFTIFASSVALRFQAFPILLITTFALMLIDWMVKSSGELADQSIRKGYTNEMDKPETIKTFA